MQKIMQVRRGICPEQGGNGKKCHVTKKDQICVSGVKNTASPPGTTTTFVSFCRQWSTWISRISQIDVQATIASQKDRRRRIKRVLWLFWQRWFWDNISVRDETNHVWNSCTNRRRTVIRGGTRITQMDIQLDSLASVCAFSELTFQKDIFTFLFWLELHKGIQISMLFVACIPLLHVWFWFGTWRTTTLFSVLWLFSKFRLFVSWNWYDLMPQI